MSAHEFFPPGYWDNLLLPLILHIVSIAVVSVGGGVAVLPDAFRYMVLTKKWLTSEDFTNMVALAQAAPGPNILMWSLISFQAAASYGLALSIVTALVGLLAFIVPTCTIAFLVNRLLESRSKTKLIKAIKTGLVPLTAGIVIASGWLLTDAAATATSAINKSDPLIWIYLLSAGVAIASYLKQINPLWMVALGGVAGLVLA
jgi:chromate transporter